MRLARLLGFLVTVLVTALTVAPAAAADAPFRLPEYVTDRAGALSAAERAEVESAIDALYNDRGIRLWVVYVEDFSGQNAVAWAQATMRNSDLTGADALLAVATIDRSFAFQLSDAVEGVSSGEVTAIQRGNIEPALRGDDWGGAAVAAANGLSDAASPGGGVSWLGFLIALLVIAFAVLLLVFVMRRRRRRRRLAEIAAAHRVDPTDPSALASVSVDGLDDLSRTKVVEVDNAVRSSENELALAVEEFGQDRTAPFIPRSTTPRSRCRRHSTCANSSTTPSPKPLPNGATCSPG